MRTTLAKAALCLTITGGALLLAAPAQADGPGTGTAVVDPYASFVDPNTGITIPGQAPFDLAGTIIGALGIGLVGALTIGARGHLRDDR
jgi:hypothetical protein